MAEIFLFRALGTPKIEGPEDLVGKSATQRRTIALLAILAASGEAGVRREKVLELLWSDADPDRARHALTQGMYQARQALGKAELFIALPHELRLNPAVITSDIAQFEAAIERGDFEGAATLYRGAFLDGFALSITPEFERWVALQRIRFSEQATRAVDMLASRAEQADDWSTAVHWLKQLATLQPVRGAVAVRLMRAMAATGDRDGALQYARVHAALVESELAAPIDPAVSALEEQLRTGAPQAQSRSTVPEEPPSTTAAVGAEQESVTASTLQHGDEPTLPHASPRASRNHKRRNVLLIAALGVILIAGVVWRMVTQHKPGTAAPPGDVLVVLPFRVTGDGPRATYLSEGLMDLLLATLSDAAPGTAADPGVLMRAWRDAGGTASDGIAFPEGIALARRFNGTQLVGGNVVVMPKQLVITGWLADVQRARIDAQATVEGPLDSLTTLVDRLSARLVAERAGQPARLADRTSNSLAAVRAYLAGRAAYRAGRFESAARQFEVALARDTTFPEAAFWLMISGNRSHNLERRARGLRLAWATRNDLTDADRAYLIAFAGPRYPRESSDRDRLLAWRSVVGRSSDRPEAWQELGEALFQTGGMLGVHDARMQAERAFQRARSLSPTFAPPIPYLVQIAALNNDRVLLDSLATTVLKDSSDAGDFARWRLALARHDPTLWRRVRARFARMPLSSVRAIAMAAQYQILSAHSRDTLADRWAREDVLPAAAALARRTIAPEARRDALLALHSAALRTGQSTVVRQALAELDDILGDDRMADRLRVTDALYDGGDSASARAAVETLASESPGAGTLTFSVPDQETGLNACVPAQWNLDRNGVPTERIQQIIIALRRAAERTDDATLLACSVLLDARINTHRDAGQRDRALHTLDSLLHIGAPLGELRAYLPVAIERIYMEMGAKDQAQTAAHRYSFMREWPVYIQDADPEVLQSVPSASPE